MRASDFEIHNYSKLDRILVMLCELVEQGQSSDKDYGMVAAAVLDPDNLLVARLNRPGRDGKRIHAERAAIEAYVKKHGDIPEGSIILTTLSPCNEHMDERDGPSCTETINDSGVKKVYCGYMDPTQNNDVRLFNVMETADADIRKRCKQFADTFLGKVHESRSSRRGVAEVYVETVDVDALHAEALREHLLSNPSLYENKEDFGKLRKFLDTHATPRPKINEAYLYASVQATPMANYMNIAHFSSMHKLVKLDQQFAYFKVNGRVKRFPESGTLRGDTLSQIYFFSSKEEFDHFNTLLKLKFSEHKQSSKVLDQQDVEENFADGRNPQDKGDSARHGIPKKASLASLDKITHSKSASPRKKQLAHWQANMRRGRAK